MRAILLTEGQERNIYLLEKIKGDIEVQIYFEKYQNNRSKSGYVAAFNRYFNIVKEEGFDKLVKGYHWKTWLEGDDRFYEFINGPERISFYDYPDTKKLVITQFSKKKRKQTKEYTRAINLRKKFETKPIWIESKEDDKHD